VRLAGHGRLLRKPRIAWPEAALYPAPAHCDQPVNTSSRIAAAYPSPATLFEAELAACIGRIDAPALQARFGAQNEFVAIEDFVTPRCLRYLTDQLPGLDGQVHRNFIPRHKKGGSVSRFALDAHAPIFGALYRSPAFVEFLNSLTRHSLQFCPATDPHTYALYYYTEPGDHIGFHYDTSYYRGERYTILLGLIDNSSCLLEYQLNRGETQGAPETTGIRLKPGMLVVFNGDRLYHRVTPLGEAERRIALTLEYVTSTSMNPVRRFVSNMKDAIAYFGFKQVFKPRASRG
jgi:hypothetical protein